MKSHIPFYVSVVALCLGCVDLARGVPHTVRVEHAARDLAGLDLAASNSIDLIILMIAFGISNLLTGSMLIHGPRLTESRLATRRRIFRQLDNKFHPERLAIGRRTSTTVFQLLQERFELVSFLGRFEIQVLRFSWVGI